MTDPRVAPAGGDDLADPEGIADRVLGRQRYTVDLELPGMLYAALARSPAATGRVRSVDAGAVMSMPGVVRVVTAADLAGMGLADDRFGTMIPDQPILAGTRIRHVGEPIAAVLARSEAEAVVAAARLRLDIEPGAAAVLDAAAALAPGAPDLHDDRPGNILATWGFEHGDLAAAEAATVRRFEGTYTSPAAQHVTMEPQVCVAAWADGELELWAATQSPDRIATELARIFGLERGAVRLRVTALGGGYGAKNHAKLEPLAAVLARLAGGPVRVANRRSDEFVTTTKHAATIHLAAGVDAVGRFTFRRARILWSAGAYAHSSLAVVRGGALAVSGPYRIPAALVESVMAYTNTAPAGSFRGLGANQAAWAGERQVDEIAAALGEDPVAFRRRNIVRSGDRLATGETVPSAHWLDCLDDVVARLGATPGEAGVGVALAMKHTMTPSRSEVELVARPDGTVEVRSNLVDMGQGLRTVLARATADALGIPLGHVRIADPDTVASPPDAGTFSSRGAWAGTTAVTAAAAELRDRLELPITGAVDLAAAVLATGQTAVSSHGTATNAAPVDEGTGVTASTSQWHQGAVAVRVVTDAETGVVRVSEALGAAWAGRVIDAGRARLQNEGGLIFGLGPTLFEALEADPAGRPTVTSLLDYRIPSVADLPGRLETAALEAGGPDAEPSGIGESVIPAVAPAVAAAVATTIDRILHDLPLTPGRVLGIVSDDPIVDPPTSWPADVPMPVTPAARPVGDPVDHRLRVDGVDVLLSADPLASLADVLRAALGPGIVRQPCGVGVCGGCTVRLDGQAVRSCLTPVGLVRHRAVETIAGVMPEAALPAALIARGAAQCGSCLPGMVQSLQSLLDHEPAADRLAIRSGLAGNLCRCGSYGPILEAAMAVVSAQLADDGGAPTATGGVPRGAAETGRS